MKRGSYYEWTEERIGLMRQMWLRGQSSGEIGHVLGVSRNAVIGKLGRLGLLGNRRRHVPSMPEREPPDQDVLRAAHLLTYPPLTPFPLLPAPAAAPLVITSITDGMCRWPTGGGGREPYYFCGEPVTHRAEPRAGGYAMLSAYCARHHAVAYIAPHKYQRRPPKARSVAQLRTTGQRVRTKEEEGA